MLRVHPRTENIMSDKRRTAFTLVEILIVVVILAIIYVWTTFIG